MVAELARLDARIADLMEQTRRRCQEAADVSEEIEWMDQQIAVKEGRQAS